MHIKTTNQMASALNQKMSLSIFICLSLASLLFTLSNAATFEVRNNCSYTVWAAAVPGGGRRLDRGQSWTFSVGPDTKQARIWGRTNCNFNAAGRGGCQTGDCAGRLQCLTYGRAPNTLAEYASNHFNNMDFIDISLVDGFNIPMDFSPTRSTRSTSGRCRGIRCAGDINGQCPNQLRVPGGCNDPCTVFRSDQYCCNFRSCGPTNFSKFFKARCPDAYSYAKDDPSCSYTCPNGTNYRVMFCP